MDDENEDKVCVELCDTLDTLPTFLCLCKIINRQMDMKDKKTNSEPEIQEIGFFEGDPVLFFPITNST